MSTEIDNDCTHDREITPVRASPYNTIYAISVCAECSEMRYVEIEATDAAHQAADAPGGML